MAAGVEFHTGVPDALQFACRLLRKAYGRGATVLCLASRAQLDLLDRMLWTLVERDFIPHVQLETASGSLLRRTPIWLATSMPVAGASRDVVLDLGGALAVGEAGDARVIEVIGAEAEEVERGRHLWRQYKAAGFEVIHHPFGATREG